MKKLSLTLVCLFLLMGSFGACEKSPDSTLIRVNEVTHSIFYAPMYLAEALGYLKEADIRIELTNGGGADNTMAAVLSGGADVGFCGPEAALYVAANGSANAPKVFGLLTKCDGSFLVSRKAEPDFTWESLRGKETLAGRKGGVPAMTFEYILNQHGLYDGKDVTLNFDVAFNLMTGAFEAGTADYCTMFEPVASTYEKAGKGYIVASVGEASGLIPYTAFMATPKWLEKNAEAAVDFLAAIAKAVSYTYTHTAKDLAKLLLPYFDGSEEDSLVSAIDAYKKINAWEETVTMSEAALENLQKVIANAGELPRKVAYAEMATTEYSEKAYKQATTK